MPDAARSLPLDWATPRPGNNVSLSALPPATRLILRGRPNAVEAAGAALGFSLPHIACRAATHGERAALWLGPDEWLVLAPDAEGRALADALEAAMAGTPHALVDVSHRQSGLTIAGPHAAATLNAGCPLDLNSAAFPVGMCTRTVLAKCEITLWRTAEIMFRVEANRSFLRYVWRFLEEASREFTVSG
jgi:sarcosine oxidase subunit gamma